MLQRWIDRVYLWTFSALLEGAVSLLRLMRGAPRANRSAADRD